MATEVEARYAVPDRALFDRLRGLEQIAHYEVEPVERVRNVDYYLDTPGRALLHQGWACRLRQEDGSWVVTLKGPKKTDGAVMDRPEYELSLPDRIEDVRRWPRGEIRSIVSDLTAGIPLRRLATIRQTRYKSILKDGLRPVAEMSLDLVTFSSKGLRHRNYMLECELEEGGALEDLEALDAVLCGEYALTAETRSKLQQALQLLARGEPSPGDSRHIYKPISLEVLCRRYDVDCDAAQETARVAEQLFDALQDSHGLDECDRDVLHTAALVHNIGGCTEQGPHHLVGRDILLRQPLEGMSAVEQRTLAAAAYLHRKRVTPQRTTEVVAENWSSKTRRQVLTIAALVRLAAAFNASTRIEAVREGEGGTEIVLGGPDALAVMQRVRKRSDLWTMLHPARLTWSTVASAERAGSGSGGDDDGLGIRAWDTMPEAARKALAHHMVVMRDHEQGTIAGEDPEELHDMRVATRRMRAALDLFGPYIAGPEAQRANDYLRQLGRILGDVRDMDIALAEARAFLAARPEMEADALEPLLKHWTRQRKRARRRMVRYLQGQSYERTVGAIEALLQHLALDTPWHAKSDQAAGRVAPRLLYLRWEMVRAYEAVLQDAPVELLHMLRITCKQLRYGIEFFEEILPRKVTTLNDQIVAVQDHLGAMHDAAVAVEMIDRFFERRSKRRLGGVQAYREERAASVRQQVETFPSTWERLMRKKNRKRFKALLEQ
jgi:CHAD domain-containing protein/uncharacterized protein YjbK